MIKFLKKIVLLQISAGIQSPPFPPRFTALVGFLCYPQFEKPFIWATDACDNGLGYVPSQEVNGTLKPLQFGGRVLTQAERRYSITDKESLAVFYAVKKLEVYLCKLSINDKGIVVYKHHSKSLVFYTMSF